MYFSQNLDYLLKIRDIPAKKLGEVLKKGESMISKYRNAGTSPTLEIAYQICNFLNVDISDMVMKDLKKALPSEIKPFNVVEEGKELYEDSLESELKYLRSRVQVLELLLERYAPDVVINKYLK